MPIKPQLPRHTVEKSGNKVKVTLPRKKRILKLLLYGFWLLIWVYITGTAFLIFGAILSAGTGFFDKPTAPNANNVFLIFSVIIFLACLQLLAMGFIVLYSFLWQIAGKEIIEVGSQTMTITRQIFGWKKSSEYFAETISDLRVSPLYFVFGLKRIFQNLLGLNGMIAFDYGAKTFRFGLEIEEAEAKQIISAIRDGLPQSKLG